MADILPSCGLDKMQDVLPQKIDDQFKGVAIGAAIEIEGTSEEMPGAVGEVELYRRGGISADVEEQAVYFRGVFHDGDLVKSAGFDLVTVGYFMRILKVFIKVVVNGFVAQVKGGFKRIEFQVLPAGFGAIAPVRNQVRIGGNLERVGAEAVVLHIGFFGKMDAEIAPWFRGNNLFFFTAGG